MSILRPSKLQKTSPSATEESITTLHSWINEQMISSISGRLAVVETRLSLVAPLSDPESRETPPGPIERLVQESKRPANARAWASVLDHDLAELRDRLQEQDHQLNTVTDHLSSLASTEAEMKTLSQGLKTEMAQTKTFMQDHLTQLEDQRGRLVTMKLGRLEIPLDLSSILIGTLAFTIAGIIAAGQKEILGDPVFLVGIGVVFLASALLKRLIHKIRTPTDPALATPLPLSDAGRLDDNV